MTTTTQHTHAAAHYLGPKGTGPKSMPAAGNFPPYVIGARGVSGLILKAETTFPGVA
jgi:hypothetical protein